MLMPKNILATQGSEIQPSLLAEPPEREGGEKFSTLMAYFQQPDLSNMPQAQRHAEELSTIQFGNSMNGEETLNLQDMLKELVEQAEALSQALDQIPEAATAPTHYAQPAPPNEEMLTEAQQGQSDAPVSLVNELTQLVQQLEQVMETLPAQGMASQSRENTSAMQDVSSVEAVEASSASFAALFAMDATSEDLVSQKVDTGVRGRSALPVADMGASSVPGLQQRLAKLTAQLQQLEQRIGVQENQPAVSFAQAASAAADEAHVLEGELEYPAISKAQGEAIRTVLARLQQYLAQNDSAVNTRLSARQQAEQALAERVSQRVLLSEAQSGAAPLHLLETSVQQSGMSGVLSGLRWQPTFWEKPSFKPAAPLQAELAVRVDDDTMQLRPEEGEAETQAQTGFSGRGAEGAAVRNGMAQPALAQSTLALPVKHPQWGERLAQRVLFLAQNNQQLAQIRLNPAHLGPIQIKMKLDQDQAVQVSLHAHHALTRDAIEQAIPRLREMFAQQGLTLGDIQVQADAQGHAQAFAQMRREASAFGMQVGHASESEDENRMAPVIQVRQDGLIDHFV